MAGERGSAMIRRKWDARTKSTVVLEGLKGMPVADICTEHQISQAQYYDWREQFLKKMPSLFIANDRREQALTRENGRLKKLVGELTLELKKRQEDLA
jgi:transposase-like protein